MMQIVHPPILFSDKKTNGCILLMLSNTNKRNKKCMTNEIIKQVETISQENINYVITQLVSNGFMKEDIHTDSKIDPQTGRTIFRFKCEITNLEDRRKNKGLTNLISRIPFFRYAKKPVSLELIFAPDNNNTIKLTGIASTVIEKRKVSHDFFEATSYNAKLCTNKLFAAFDESLDGNLLENPLSEILFQMARIGQL